MATAWSSYFSNEGLEYTRRSVKNALEEDGREVAALALFGPEDIMEARIVAKEETLVVGLPIASMGFDELGTKAKIDILAEEGRLVSPMTEVMHISAPSASLLKAERIILNFVCHLSGIANLTRRYVQELEGTGVTLLDTRKTTPGLRWLEKYAVQIAGAQNHRRNLEEMLMLKDNHIDQAGSITKAVLALREKVSPCPPIEVECRTLDDVNEAVSVGVDRVMMDNMREPTLSRALSLVPKGIETEVSGGVSLDNLRSIARSVPKPDFISVGRLTHSAVTADFSMMLRPVSKPKAEFKV